MAVETVPLDNVPPLQMDEAGPSGTVASSITEAISVSMQVPSGEPHEVASSSGTTLELPTSSSTYILELIALSILSVVLPQSAAEVIDEDVVLRPVTIPHAMAVEALLKKFLALLKDVVPPLL